MREKRKINKIQRGDIVWARTIHFPHNNNSLPSQQVSSFGHIFQRSYHLTLLDNPNTPQRTFFVNSEVIHYDELLFRNDTFQCEAFNSALKLFSLRIYSSLQCRCITGHNEEERVLNGSGYQFDPVRVLVLGFGGRLQFCLLLVLS